MNQISNSRVPALLVGSSVIELAIGPYIAIGIKTSVWVIGPVTISIAQVSSMDQYMWLVRNDLAEGGRCVDGLAKIPSDGNVQWVRRPTLDSGQIKMRWLWL